jgi:preprotein translocase subunit SecE
MDRKWTYLMFAVGGLLLAYLLTRSGFWAWEYLATSDFAGDYVGKPKELLIDLFGFGVAGIVTAVALRNERLVELANEVTAELRKVTWPTREETFAATIVVIVTVIVASIFLGLFDLLWSWVARAIYG